MEDRLICDGEYLDALEMVGYCTYSKTCRTFVLLCIVCTKVVVSSYSRVLIVIYLYLRFSI